jgi:hypothetical protein
LRNSNLAPITNLAIMGGVREKNAAGSLAMLAFLGEAAAVSWHGNDNAQPHCAHERHFFRVFQHIDQIRAR